jgi:peptide/nickel transport system permease protein
MGRWKKLKANKDVLFALDYLRHNPLAVLGIVIVGSNIFLALFAPWIVPYDPYAGGVGQSLEPPSSEHWFGTDRTGMDVFSRVIYAPRIDLTIGIVATLIAVLIGAPLGVFSGYYRGLLPELVARAADVVQCFPVFIVAMTIVFFTGQTVQNVIITLAVLNAPIFVRLMRAKTYALRERKFVEAARCMGNSDGQLLVRHLLPNTMEVVLVQFSVNVGWAILMAAGLSFIGAGVRIPTPELGSMISIGAPDLMTGQWWTALFPGLAVGITVLGLALVGSAAEVLLDPTRR